MCIRECSEMRQNTAEEVDLKYDLNPRDQYDEETSSARNMQNSILSIFSCAKTDNSAFQLISQKKII